MLTALCSVWNDERLSTYFATAPRLGSGLGQTQDYDIANTIKRSDLRWRTGLPRRKAKTGTGLETYSTSPISGSCPTNGKIE